MLTRYFKTLDARTRGPLMSCCRRRKAGSVIVLFTLMVPFVLVPMVGLAIDGTMMYSVRSKLQTAVDGAAIAAAQSLKTGVNFAAQKATAEKTADQFIKANIQVGSGASSGYWGASNLNDTQCDNKGQPVAGGTNPCIVAAEDNVSMRRTVSVTASVRVPLIFMRIFGFSAGTVSAQGTASRRDVVLVLVLDRSSSMTDTLDALKDGATYFTNQFQSARDRLGLVVFGGSAIVAYPPTDWGKAVSDDGLTLTGASGPDTSFKDTPDTDAAPNMLTSISNVKVGSNTGTAEALWLAYLELKKANQPGALNVIVLFTDGSPNGITSYFNQRNVSIYGSGAYVSNGANPATNPASTCAWPNEPDPNKIPPPVFHPMIGWFAQGGGNAAGNTSVSGIFGLMQTDQTTQTTVSGWLANGTEPMIPFKNASDSGNGCYFAQVKTTKPTVTYHTDWVAKDIVIPAVDRYGNSTQGKDDGLYKSTDYKLSSIWNDTDKCNNGNQPPKLDLSQSDDACQVGLASWNAADMAAKRIREDASGISPRIYTMGYTGNGGIDELLLMRMANVKHTTSPVNTVFDSTKPQGLYLKIKTVNDITPAFQSVLAEILRLTT